jgi:NAD(P)-dependent dehydrogenase (short-subunit alcohol dehydrogenase family)
MPVVEAQRPLLVVVGAGPGIGAALARRFARDGYDVGLIARGRQRLDELGMALRAEGISATWTPLDISDADALAAAVDRFGTRSRRIDRLHFNPSVFRAADPLTLSAEELLADLAVGVAPLLTAVRAARPWMPPGARVTVTGSMAADQPSPGACSLGVQKAGLRNLVHSLDATLSARSVRAVSVTVNGVLAAGTPFAPEGVAEAIHRAASRSDGQWTSEVPYDGAQPSPADSAR